MDEYPTSSCTHCNMSIYMGPGEEPKTKNQKLDDGWKVHTWRHHYSKKAACEMTFAAPVQIKDCGLVTVG